MSAGKLVLLLVVGGLAGAAFATVTTRSLPRYSAADHSRELSADMHPAARSWLDQGVSALNSPAWPFGRGEVDDQSAQDGYAPYGYGPPGDADDDAWERRQYGQREMLPAPLPDEHDPAYAAAGPPAGPQDAAAHDAAASAAARAADAAQDVAAAENTP